MKWKKLSRGQIVYVSFHLALSTIGLSYILFDTEVLDEPVLRVIGICFLSLTAVSSIACFFVGIKSLLIVTTLSVLMVIIAPIIWLFGWIDFAWMLAGVIGGIMIAAESSYVIYR